MNKPTPEQTKAFSEMLKAMATELSEYSEAIVLAGYDMEEVDWDWSTYALVMQGALYDQMADDGDLPDPEYRTLAPT